MDSQEFKETTEQNPGLKDYGTDYAKGMASEVINDCLRLGLDPGFEPVYRMHLNEIHFVEVPVRKEDVATIISKSSIHKNHPIITPCLTVQSIINDETNSTEINRNDPPRVRAMMVSLIDIGIRRTELEEIFKLQNLVVDNNIQKKLQVISTDWIFYELCIDALGNACYMQQTFPDYVADFDGQNPYYHTERTLSAAFLLKSNVLETKDLKHRNVVDDSQNLKKGFGLMMLHKELLAHGLVDKTKKADWIIAELRRRYPDAYRSEDIEKRLNSVKPRYDVRASLAELALSVYDPVLDDKLEQEELIEIKQ